MKDNWSWIIVSLLALALIGLLTMHQLKRGELEQRIVKLIELNDASFEHFGEMLETMREMEEELQEVNLVKEQMEEVVKSKMVLPLGEYDVTAYDLSVASCGKSPGQKGYGITASGKSLVGKTRKQARAIAVDPKKIPLGSKVYVEIKGEYNNMSGVYTAKDTGGVVKGNIIDLFMGDFKSTKEHPSVPKFGRRRASVYLLK